MGGDNLNRNLEKNKRINYANTWRENIQYKVRPRDYNPELSTTQPSTKKPKEQLHFWNSANSSLPLIRVSQPQHYWRFCSEFFVVGIGVFLCKMFSSIPDLCPLDASRHTHDATTTPSVTTKNFSRHCQMSLQDKITPDWEPLLQTSSTEVPCRKPINGPQEVYEASTHLKQYIKFAYVWKCAFFWGEGSEVLIPKKVHDSKKKVKKHFI